MSDIATYFAAIARLAFRAWGVSRNVSVLLLSLVALLLAATVGLELTFTQYAGQLWLRLLAIAFLFLFFVVAPYRLWLAQRQEAQAREREITVLQSQVAAKVASQAKIDRLWNLREDGVSIRNLRLTDPTEVPAWLRQVQEWRGHTLEAAEQVSPNLRAYLEVLDQTRDPPVGVTPVSPDHARWHRVMSEILLRLGEYLGKLP
jgi:hypothetical protein